MHTQSRTNGNGGNGRGVAGRPDVKAREKFGEERVIEIFADNKAQIMGLLANESDREAAFLRAQSLAVAAYRKAQSDSDVKIDEQSMCATCIWALRQKLDVGTEVWCVPYNGKITPIVSPDGMITLAMRSGHIAAINYSAVFEGDHIEHVLGTTNMVEHKKTGKRPRAVMKSGRVQANPALWNALIGAWCVIELKGGGKIVVYFNKDEIEYFRSLSPFGESASGPWAKYGDAMSEIRALKRGLKRAPKSTEVSAILLSSEDSDGVEIPDEVWKSIGANMVKEMTGDRGSSPGEEPPPATKGSAGRVAVTNSRYAGDPKRVTIPGGKDKPPVAIAEASEQQLTYWENRLRTDMLAGKWTDQYYGANQEKLATVRDELIRRGHGVEPLPQLDGTSEPEHVDNVPEFVGHEPGMEG